MSFCFASTFCYLLCFSLKTSKNNQNPEKTPGSRFQVAPNQHLLYRISSAEKKKQNRRPKKANIEEDRFGHSAVQLQGHQALQVRLLERLNLCDWSNPVRLVFFSFFLGAGKKQKYIWRFKPVYLLYFFYEVV